MKPIPAPLNKAIDANQTKPDRGAALGETQQDVQPLALVRGKALLDRPLDLFIPPDALEIILEMFEGPLDLLIYLIRKQKFDIGDLPIAPITVQYMEYVEQMKHSKLELAAEYLVMAAILAEIKSRMLLPKQVVDDEEVDPRAELIRRLQAYEVVKQRALKLDELPRLERDIHLVTGHLANNFVQNTQAVEVDLAQLVNAMAQVIERNDAFEHHHIQKETLSTRERMSAILHQLRSASGKMPFVEFSALFKPSEGKQGVVVTFLAILELIKEALIECVQSQHYGQLQVKLKQFQA